MTVVVHDGTLRTGALYGELSQATDFQVKNLFSLGKGDWATDCADFAD